MPTKVEIPDRFTNLLFKLARKYPAVIKEFEALGEQLKMGVLLGDQVPNVGYEVYKVRLKNPSAGKGKSGGFRVLYYLRQADYLTLITIYAKTEYSDITPEGIRELIEEILEAEDDSEEE